MKNIKKTYIIENLNEEETVRTFYEKGLQKANQLEFRIEKVIKRKVDKLYVRWKGYLIFEQTKNSLYYFPELYTPNKSKIRFQLDLSNYVTKSDSNSEIVINISIFAKKVDLATIM